jgi:hypothetical protein
MSQEGNVTESEGQIGRGGMPQHIAPGAQSLRFLQKRSAHLRRSNGPFGQSNGRFGRIEEEFSENESNKRLTSGRNCKEN